MEIKKILKLLKKNALYLLVFLVAGAFLGAYLGKSAKSSPHAQLDLFIAPKNVQKTQASDDYYLQEQARNFTDSALVILESPDFTNGLTTPGQSISAAKLAPQVVRLTTSAGTNQDAQNLLANTIDSFNGKLAGLTADNLNMSLKPISTSARTFTPVVSTGVFSAAGAIFGLLFALVVVALRAYFDL